MNQTINQSSNWSIDESIHKFIDPSNRKSISRASIHSIHSFPIFLGKTKPKMSQKKIGTGYCSPSDSDRLQYRFRFSFGSNPHFQAIATQGSLLTFESVCALLYVSLHCFILITRATNLFKDWGGPDISFKKSLKIRCKAVVNSTRKRLARLVSNPANTGKLVARPPLFVASCFWAAFSALEFPTFWPEMLGKTWAQVLLVLLLIGRI